MVGRQVCTCMGDATMEVLVFCQKWKSAGCYRLGNVYSLFLILYSYMTDHSLYLIFIYMRIGNNNKRSQKGIGIYTVGLWTEHCKLWMTASRASRTAILKLQKPLTTLQIKPLASLSFPFSSVLSYIFHHLIYMHITFKSYCYQLLVNIQIHFGWPPLEQLKSRTKVEGLIYK